MTSILNKFMPFSIVTLALLILIGVLSFSRVEAGEYSYLDEARREDPKLNREAKQWVIRGAALIEKIDRLIQEWHGEKERDFEQEAVAQALTDLGEYLRRENELLNQARSDCKQAGGSGVTSCPAVANHQAKIGNYSA